MSKRKIGFILVLSMLMAIAFASVAMAAQTKLGPQGSDAKSTYAATYKAFNPDDNNLYPNEIYLPSESNPAGYRIHSNYTKNTDACAACHATHTAVGQSLLQWTSVYEACMACHDGTITSTYNVKGGYIANTGSRTFGGAFGTGTEQSWSNHNVTGAVDISAAPGGSTTATSTEVDPVHGNAKASWEVEFGCQSCHSPHGQGGNARILSPDPNGKAWEQYNIGKTKKVQLVAAAEVKAGYTAYKIDVTDVTYGNLSFAILGYPYSKVTALYDNTYTGTVSASNFILDNTNSTYTVVYVDNSVAASPYYLDYVPALKVKMNISNYLQANESVAHVSGMNNFCGACHTDYNTSTGGTTGSASNLNGQYSEAYRHQVGMTVSYFNLSGLKMPFESGKMTCETCHFAHGTNKDYWNATQDTTRVSGDWGNEIASSSALKRLPNMGVCEACHAKGDGNQGYGMTVTAVSTTASTQAGATFTGSNQCATCHQSHKNGWQTTLHSKLIGNGPSTVLAAARGTGNTFKGNVTFRDNVTGAAYGPDDIVYTIGTKWKQRYLVGNATDGYHFLEKQFNVKDGTWQNYTNSGDWDKDCTSCHTTGLKVTADDGNGNLTQSWSELNVGCEACHGPGSNHAKSPSATNIKNPAKFTNAQQAKACGYCHIRGQSKEYKIKFNVTQFNDATRTKLEYREDAPAPLGQTFIPFDPVYGAYENWAVIAGVTPGVTLAQAVSGQPTINVDGENFVEASGILKTADAAGRMPEGKHHQQYQGLLQSRHLTQNVLTCNTCHSNHSKNSSKEQLKLSGAQTCGQCHGGVVTSGTYSIGANPAINTYMPGTGNTLATVGVRSHVFSPEAPNWGFTDGTGGLHPELAKAATNGNPSYPLYQSNVVNP